MNKITKIIIISIASILLLGTQMALFATSTKESTTNYWWAAGLAALAILCGVLGLITARHWSWLKSGVGQGVFFISLGIIIWGLAQAGWVYFLFNDAGQEAVQSKFLDVLYLASVPLWIYGILKLSKATGAKYGLRQTKGKLLVIVLSTIMVIFSFFFLIIIARGGFSYFDNTTIWVAFFDLGYAIGDVVIVTILLSIFGLSWKYLGGRFKYPILAIIAGFVVWYWADFAFSFADGKGTYYNGDISDTMYLIAITTLGIALCMIDPSTKRPRSVAEESQPVPNLTLPTN